MDKHTKLRERLISDFATDYPAAIVEMDGGLRTRYPLDARLFLAERFSRILQADTDWFEHVISHQPTVGAFYEVILRNALKQLAPRGCEIATGFVLDPYRPVHSKQLDIIAYDSNHSSPVFKNGDLVVVRPSSVVSLTEVKKTLRMRDIEETIDGTFFSNLGTRRPGTNFESVQRVNLFGFSSKLKPARIAIAVRDYLNKKIQYTRVRHKASKREGSIVLSQIVLPDIFIRSERVYVRCDLSPAKSAGSFKIRVSVLQSSEQDSCVGAFMLSALPMFQGEQVSFLGHEMQVVIDETETENVLVLSTLVSMEEVDAAFPNDNDEIRKFRVKGSAPHAVFVPKGIAWNRAKSFSEFVQRVGEHAFQIERPPRNPKKIVIYA